MEAWGLEPQRLDSVPARRSGAEIEHRGRQTRLVGAGRTPWKPRISTRSAGGRDEWDPGTPLRAIGFGRRLGDKRARGRAETPVSAESRPRELRRGDAQDPDRSHVRRRRPGRVPRGSASRSRSSRVPQSSGCSDLGGNEPHALQQCSAARLPNGSSGDEPMDGSGPRGREAMRGGNRRGGEKPRGRKQPGTPVPGRCGPARLSRRRGGETPGGEPRSEGRGRQRSRSPGRGPSLWKPSVRSGAARHRGRAPQGARRSGREAASSTGRLVRGTPRGREDGVEGAAKE